tara:strand:+ start:26 stop:352 length:327 start_codon:yes stop_codon:yes gene_type:complete
MKNNLMLLFNDGNESAVMFPADTLSSITTADQAVTMLFGRHPAKHKIVMSATDTLSGAAALKIGREIAEKMHPRNIDKYNVLTILDEDNSVKIADDLIAITTLSCDIG